MPQSARTQTAGASCLLHVDLHFESMLEAGKSEIDENEITIRTADRSRAMAAPNSGRNEESAPIHRIPETRSFIVICSIMELT